MIFNRLTSTLSALALVGAIVSAVPAFAETVMMKATLEGAQQVPPVESMGKGTADITYDTTSRKLEWTVEYSGLGEEPAAGHIHGPAEKSANAGVLFPFDMGLQSPIKGSTTLTEAQAADLMAGKYYVNLHTPSHKGGEIRGQIEKGGM